ncbi:hypothetical protein CTAM01_08255 [Colletotrichum tamarilloi]|uniref:DUF4246 domain-containing protein n=1 Tax=Colletotrichum tamarilloi TaxID=1209934 RepID=A0ABQ9R6Q6_9PEZI|nr:uncharacterized protein CTAM01_08255 [Colletotrichum tamarilloi]KAK1496617.1 hypothetical protein CTAM01_08255 [Colletotrichum tamarilloi]
MCIDELQEKARLYNETGVVPVLDVQVRIARSDRVISSDMKSTFQEAVGNIERTLSRKTDRGSGKKNSLAEANGSTCKKQDNVINVIDPTMYPLVFGRSRVLPTHEIDLHNCLSHISQGITIKIPGQKETQKYVDGIYHTLFSSQSQWLPCNIEFPDGINAKITSYINNLHPREHRAVYSVLENIITQIMPMWNMVYSSVYDHTMRCDLRIDCTEAGWKYPNTPPYDPLNIRDDLMNGVIDNDEWQRRTDEWLRDFRVVDRPEPQVKEDRAFHRSSHEHNNSVTPQGIANFTGMLSKAGGIQIVVKIRAMYPTPEDPICDLQNEFGLDGALNEHIVATAVYFFEDENVTDSDVSFQTRFQGLNFEEDCTFVVGDLRPLDEIFGLRHKTPSLQKIGSATMREGLVLVYPNVMQQKESAFQLKDPTQPGHRKVLTLYLVDPRVKILSTANVPPQQADWWAAEFTSREGQMKGLPKEVGRSGMPYNNYNKRRGYAIRELHNTQSPGEQVPACEDAVHDGHKVLPQVLEWHTYLRNSSRRADTISCAVLDLVDQYMLVEDPKRRFPSTALCKELDRIVSEAESTYRLEVERGTLKKESEETLKALLKLDNLAPSIAAPFSQFSADSKRANDPKLSSPTPSLRNRSSSAVRSHRVRKSVRFEKIVSGKTVNREEVIKTGLGISSLAEEPEDIDSSSQGPGPPLPGVSIRPPTPEDSNFNPSPEPEDPVDIEGGATSSKAPSCHEIAIVQEYHRRSQSWAENQGVWASIIFVVDNAATMKSHWEDVKITVLTLAMMIGTLDKNGLGLVFTLGSDNNVFEAKGRKMPSKFPQSLSNAYQNIDDRSRTDMATTLARRFDAYKNYSKMQTLLILTDGLWEGSNLTDNVVHLITQFVEGLKKKVGKRERRWFSIQFISFGKSKAALERLRKLDDELKTVEDVVDTKP